MLCTAGKYLYAVNDNDKDNENEKIKVADVLCQYRRLTNKNEFYENGVSYK